MATAHKLQDIVNQWSSCADCDDPYPEWADVSRGIIVCLECSGVHRSLGTHISQIRSLTLDVWQSQWVNVMQASNQVFNEVYEYHVPSQYIKPTQHSSRDLREQYIIAKYIGSEPNSVELKPLFHREHESNLNLDRLQPVYDDVAASDDDDNDTFKKVTKNGTKPWRNRRDNDSKKKHSLHERRNSGMIVNTGVLHIFCMNAINLPKGNLKSKKSCYCSFDSGSQFVNTKIVKKDSKPFWKQNLILSVNENECIKIAVYNKSESDLLCYNYLDLKNYPQVMQQEKCEIRDYQLFVAKKYRNNKRYTKDGKKILLNFDVTYNKMSSINLGKNKRESLILDNTKIFMSTPTVKEEEEEYSITMLETDHMQLIDEDEDEDETIVSMHGSDDDSNSDESSSSPPPIGHPLDTVDTFVSFNDDDDVYDAANNNNNNKVAQCIRLTASMSVNSYLKKNKDRQQFIEEEINELHDDIKDMEIMNAYDEESTHINKLVEFTRDECDYVDIIGLIDSLRVVLRINDDDRCNILCECIEKLNDYIFDTERDDILKHKKRKEDEDALNGINDTIIDSLRVLNNELMNNHLICNHLQNIFLNISDDNKYMTKQYLIHNLSIVYNRHNDELMFKNLLESADADTIEYIFNEILKLNDGDSYKLHEVMDLIVDCINNNNIKVKRLSVEILSKFSRDVVIQRSILEYSNEILRFLYLIDNEAFINISYNIMLSVSLNKVTLDIYGVHYNAMQKYIAQQLVDDYDAQQYNDDINPILYAIKSENSYILSENKLINIINANLEDVQQYELDYNDMLNIAKSKQILNFQTKTQCALIMQNMFRSWHQRHEFMQIMKENKTKQEQSKDLMAENEQFMKQITDSKENSLHLNEKLQQQQNEISQLQKMIEKLKSQQQETKLQQMNAINEKNSSINQLKDENNEHKSKIKHQNEIITKQMNEIQQLKDEHIADKQQFTIKMDNEMNKLRNELKIIGSNQQKLLLHNNNENSKNNTQTSFFVLW